VVRHWRAPSAAVAAAFAVAGLLAGCSSSNGNGNGSSKTASANSVLTVTTGSAGVFADNFNLFSPNSEDPTNGMIYEPLFFYDTAKSGSVLPWLATSATWSNGGESVAVQLRHNVTWTDGTPFTSADVVYTFELAIKDKALNKFGLPLASVTANGSYAVTINFTSPAYSDAYYALGKVEILPQHIWQSVSNPTTTLNQHPVGTGAYELTSISGQTMTFTANPHYYFPGLPKFKTIRFISYNSNTSSDAAIENGTIDWAGSYIPDIQKLYLAANPKYAVSDIPLSTAFLVPNLTSGPTANLAVREAISDALNRTYISNTVYNGYASPTNPEALILPNYKAQLSPALSGASFGSPDPALAEKTLRSAGIKLPLSLSVDMVSGYTDYLSDLQIIQQELKAADINLTINQPVYSAFIADQSTGNFQMLMDNFGYTPDPYSYYYSLLDSTVAPPIGQADSVGDYNRFKNPTVNSLLAAIAATNNTAAQNPDFYKIEQIFASQLPDIPLFNQQDEIEFNGNVVANYPTVQNAYGAPAVYIQPDIGWIAARLAPAS
jgi:peptide/nickel transport system substrate-binding protein